MEAKKYATKQPMSHWRNEREIKNYLEKHENGNNDPKSMEHNKSSISGKWEVGSI